MKSKLETHIVPRLCILCCALTLCVRPVSAHDAGPSQCRHHECSGGVVPDQIPDTKPKFAGSQLPNPGRVADCPAGFTNNGLTCGRGAQTISAPSRTPSCPSGFTNFGLFCGGTSLSTLGRTLPASAMVCPGGFFLNATTARCHQVCPAGFTNTGETCFRGVSTLAASAMSCGQGEVLNGVRCFPASGVCPPDRELFGDINGIGGLCFTKCPAGSTRTAVSTCVHNINWRANTHLWVVNRALDLLAKESNDPVARTAVNVMNSRMCRGSFDPTRPEFNNPALKGWEDGLWETDDGELADSPASDLSPTPQQGSHFFNGAGLDAFGNPTSVVTYKYLGVERNVRGNARSNAKALVDSIATLTSGAPTAADCYSLGRALHYVTDLTQPMHSTSFSGGDLPLILHPAVEEYMGTVQSRFPASASWDRRFSGATPDEAVLQTSIRAAALAPRFMKALTGNDGTICTIKLPDVLVPYTGFCFVQDVDADAVLGEVLNDGYQSTASFIAAAFAPPRVPPSTSSLCAAEGEICRVPAGRIGTVWYGAEGNFAARPAVTGTLDCNNQVFGDPAPAIPKTCRALTVTAPLPPAEAPTCASEGETCAIPAGRSATIWYGANSSFAFKTGVTGSILCSVNVFGDPLPSVSKGCRILVQPPAAPPSDASVCAEEGGRCNVPAAKTATVWYGANGSFNLKVGVVNQVDCTNDVFGDPIGGVHKTCRLLVE